MPMHLEIVTAERVVLSGEVDMVSVPTRAGRVGILPRHSPLLSVLQPGEMHIIQEGQATYFAVSGGFLEVLPTRVTVLADTVERADEIDEERAEQARARAEERKRSIQSEHDMIHAEAELRRAMVRLRVIQLRRRDGR